MSMTKLAVGIGAAALAATLSLPAFAADARGAAVSDRGVITDMSSRDRHHHSGNRHHSGNHHAWRHYRGHRYGWYGRPYRAYPRYGYYGSYYGGPRAYVSLPFVSFGIW